VGLPIHLIIHGDDYARTANCGPLQFGREDLRSHSRDGLSVGIS
jgi:hypothetical protein